MTIKCVIFNIMLLNEPYLIFKFYKPNLPIVTNERTPNLRHLWILCMGFCVVL